MYVLLLQVWHPVRVFGRYARFLLPFATLGIAARNGRRLIDGASRGSELLNAGQWEAVGDGYGLTGNVAYALPQFEGAVLPSVLWD